MKDIVDRVFRFVLNRINALVNEGNKYIYLKPIVEPIKQGQRIRLFMNDGTIVTVTVEESQDFTEIDWVRHLDNLITNAEKLTLSDDRIREIDREIQKIYELGFL